MKKDAEKLLKYIINKSKMYNDAKVNVNINEINDIPNIKFAKDKLLSELETEGMISGYKENVLGELCVYLATEGLEYFDNSVKDKNTSEIVLNISGGQVNIANDNAMINAALQSVDRSYGTNSKRISMGDLLINFCDEDCFVYSTNMPENSLIITGIDEINKNLNMCVKFNAVPENDFSDKFVGYCIKDLPDDWSWLIYNNYFLNIDYESDNEIDMWVEIKTPLIELYKKKFLLNKGSTISIDLGKYMRKKEKWVDVSELCLVFRPYYEKSANSNIKITDIGFIKL